MVAIKDMEMPKNCIECNHMDIQQAINCQLIYSGCANCGRHPNCPLVEIEERKEEKWIPVVNVDNSPFDNVKERKVEKCTDCNEYNQEKHYCPKFCDVIRDVTKEMQEFYKGEHEKLEKIEQIVNDKHYSVKALEYEIKEVLEQE